MSDIRNFEEYRKQVLDSLGEDYTVEDLRNFERWRLKVLEGLQAISSDPEAIKEAVEDWLDAHPEATTTVEDGAIATAKLASSAVTTAKIADGAVTDAKLASSGVKADVANLKSDLGYIAEVGKNLYNKNRIVKDAQINASGNIITVSDYSVSDIIYVDSNTTYTFSHDGIAENGWISKVAFWDSTGTLLDYVTPSAVFTTPNNCSYLRFYTSTTRMEGNLQLEKGASATSYEPYTLYPKIKNEVDNIEERLKVTYTPYVVNGSFVSKADGQIASSSSYGATDYIKVVGGEKINLKGFYCPNGTNASVCSYDSSFNFISAIVINEVDGGKGKDITLGASVSYIRVSTTNGGNVVVTFYDRDIVDKIVESTPIILGTITDDKYISKLNGEPTGGTSYFSITDFIEINATGLDIANPYLESNAGICEYDENQNFISCILSNVVKGLYHVKLSPNAKYIRATLKKSGSLLRIYPQSNETDNNAEDIVDFWEVATGNQIKTPYKKINALNPTVTFIDDDTMSVSAVQRYHTILSSKNVKGCYAVVTKYLEQDANLKALLLGYEDDGFGMLFHAYWQDTYYMDNSNRDIALAEADYCKGMRDMRTFGFLDYNYWVAPYGVMDSEIQSMCKRHGARCLMSTSNSTYIRSNGLNGKAETVDRYAMPRCSLGYNDTQYPNFTLADLKAQIDKCVENNGWIIITTHVQQWAEEYGDTPDQRLAEVIQYALDSGCDIKTFAEAYAERNAILQMNDIC